MSLDVWLASVIVLILLLLDKDTTSMKRYTLSAMAYDEETGRPKALGIYKAEVNYAKALRTANELLDLTPEALLIEIYDRQRNKYEHISRLNRESA